MNRVISFIEYCRELENEEGERMFHINIQLKVLTICMKRNFGKRWVIILA